MLKRILSVTLTLLMMLTLGNLAFFSASAAENSKYMVSDIPAPDLEAVDGTVFGYVGDSDLNSVVNVKDATNIQKYIASIVQLSERALLLSDSDYNGIVNVKDATTVQKYLADIDTEGKVMHVIYEQGEHTHRYSDMVVAPTCQSAGYTNHQCLCGDEYRTDEVSALEHDYNKNIVQATCTQEGYTAYTCTLCGDSYQEGYTEKAEHNYSGVVTKPTCEAGGYTTYTCTDCGESYVSDEVGKIAHEYNSDHVCIMCSITDPSVDPGELAFDKVADWMEENGVLSEDGTYYMLYSEDFVFEGFVSIIFYFPEYDCIEICAMTETEGMVSMLDIYRGEELAEYYVYGEEDQENILALEGNVVMDEFTMDTKKLIYTSVYNPYNEPTETIQEAAAECVKLCLVYYELYDVAFEMPASIQELGFSKFSVE